MRRKVEQEGYLQEPSKASQPQVATGFQKNNHLMGFAQAPPSSQLSPTGQPSVNSDYPYYHISDAQNVSPVHIYELHEPGYRRPSARLQLRVHLSLASVSGDKNGNSLSSA